MSGVLNLVIDGVTSLLEEEGFDIPPEIEKAVENYRKESDTVQVYLDENKICHSNRKHMTLREMYHSYRIQCLDNGDRPVSKQDFSKRLRKLGYEVDKHGKAKIVVVFCEQAE